VTLDDDPMAAAAAQYGWFARWEAQGRSPLYESFTAGMAGDSEVLGLIVALPAAKRQPNLVLGAVHYLFGALADYGAFRAVLVERWDEIRDVILSHQTQTNEAARCATLLPLLAGLPQPLALLEVGSSAGLCLLPDHYRYDYGDGVFGPPDSPVLLRCDARGGAPVPAAVPEVAWRAGIDLNPIDVNDPAAVGWLEALVWPDEEERLERLRAAIGVARADPPPLTQGDLVECLADVASKAPSDATLVVFHTAVLTYLSAADRDRFATEVRRLGATWVANEALGVLPSVEAKLRSGETDGRLGDFLLSRNGEPVAWTDTHGTWVEWRGDR
jgi:hypothetical protein